MNDDVRTPTPPPPSGSVETDLAQRDALLRIASRMARLGAWWIEHEPALRVWGSDEVREIFGLPPGVTPDTDWLLAHVAPEYRQVVLSLYENCEREGVPWDVEFEILDLRGQRRWARTFGEAVRGDHGRVVGIRGALQDITAEKEAAALLATSQRRYRDLSDAMPFIVWTATPDGTIDYLNRYFFDYTGAGADGPLGARWAACVHPDDLEAVTARWREAVRAGEPFEAEYLLRRDDGSYRWFRVQGTPLRDGDRVLGWYGAGIDVHTARRLEHEATRFAAQLTATLESITDGFYALDRAWRFTYVNAEAERLLRHARSDLLGRSLWELFPDLGGTVFEREFRRAVAENVTVSFETRYEPLAMWAEVRAYPSAEGLTVYLRDASERKRLEAQLLRAQRLESVGTLAGGIAHDLNNVLSPILTSVAFLRDDERDPGKLEDLATLESCARRGAEMVRQLLLFARGEPGGARVPLRLGDVAAEVLKLVRDTIPRSITTTLAVEGAAWPVLADATQMRQLLMNLCVNARDAMPDGGSLTVSVDELVLDETSAAAFVRARPGAYVRMRVQDTGEGMSQEVQDRAFEPFFTTKEVGRGTGLGLSTCHAIVRDHGGFIHLESSLGRGARFDVYLPAASPAPIADEAVVEHARLPRGAGETVLLVEDEDAVRRVTARTLERYGYRVLAASNGAEAVSLFALNQRVVALVLTDMSMPIMDGPATVVALRSIAPTLKIVGSSGLDLESAARSEGARLDAFLPKPYTAPQLLQTVRRVIG